MLIRPSHPQYIAAFGIYRASASFLNSPLAFGHSLCYPQASILYIRHLLSTLVSQFRRMPFSALMLRAEYEFPPRVPTVLNPGGDFWTVDTCLAAARRFPPSPMSQNPHTIPKIRLVLQHTVAGRAVFYCVSRDTSDPKSATFGIKNRVRAHRPQRSRPVFIDIEPPAEVPYINRLTEHSLSNPRKEKALP